MIAVLMKWIVPWEFSWIFLAVFLSACVLYWRGCQKLPVSRGRRIAFWSGMAIVYLSLQTYFDFYAEHEFFMHRIQQLLLHHLAPLIIMASYPGSVLRAGLPLRWRVHGLRPALRTWPWRVISAVLLNPAVATILFVVFILIWLIPSMQTMAMLDWRVYRFMNWSMIDQRFYLLVAGARSPAASARAHDSRYARTLAGYHDDAANSGGRHHHLLQGRSLSDLRNLWPCVRLQRLHRSVDRRDHHLGACGDHRDHRWPACHASMVAPFAQWPHSSTGAITTSAGRCGAGTRT
jgi:hypothetical protein